MVVILYINSCSYIVCFVLYIPVCKLPLSKPIIAALADVFLERITRDHVRFFLLYILYFIYIDPAMQFFIFSYLFIVS